MNWYHKQLKPAFLVCVWSLTSLLSPLKAQDTLTLMTYNLMNYYNEIISSTGSCTKALNPPASKNQHIKTILQYVQPAAFVVNEHYYHTYYNDTLLVHAVRPALGNTYKQAPASNRGNSTLLNRFYYDSTKLGLLETRSLQFSTDGLRDIVLWRCYYKASGLSQGADTVYLNFIGSHLKAGTAAASGNTPSDAARRGIQVNGALIALRTTCPTGNYFWMGDQNTYTSSEVCYQYLVNAGPEYRFYDPINRPGSWDNNSAFAAVHTQSTQSTGINTCFSGGGSDSRFDFILMSRALMQDSLNAGYISGSYKAVGQDGNHYNKSINATPANNSAPATVINAIYNNSDHYPVTAKIKVTPLPVSAKTRAQASFKLRVAYNNASPVIYTTVNKAVSATIYNAEGRPVWQQQFAAGNGNTITPNLNNEPAGLYIAVITTSNNRYATCKIVKRF